MQTTSVSSQTSQQVTILDFKFSRSQVICVMFFVLLLFIAVPMALDWPTNKIGSAGGVLGILCSLVVVKAYLFNSSLRSSSSLSLLFFRTLCDMGIAIRFVLFSAFNHEICHEDTCHIRDNDVRNIDDEEKCSVASAVLQFFEMASEMWFLCLSVDIFISVTNPLASFKKRLMHYHLLAWGTALIFAIILSVDENLYGFFFVDYKVDNTAICWIKSKAPSSTRINFRPWVFLYIPLITVYIYAGGVIYYVYQLLQKGLSRTFQHRVHVLVLNIINVFIYMCYWALLGLCYVLTFLTRDQHSRSEVMFQLLLFFIASKGFADLIVWIVLNYADINSEHTIDFNSILREEVVHYATYGIRFCAEKKCSNFDIQKLPIFILHVTQPNAKTSLTLGDLIRFILSGGRGITAMFPAVDNVQSTSPISNANNTLAPPHPVSVNPVMRESSTSNLSRLLFHAFIPSRFSGFPDNERAISLSRSDSDARGSNPVISPFQAKEQPDGDHPASVDIESVRPSQSSFSQQRGSVKFTEYEPYYFRCIRLSSGLSDEDYIESFQQTAKERLTEGGASGAFFFFSLNDQYIAKSCNADEFQHIRLSAQDMAKHFAVNKNSYITKVFGLYKLNIYDTTFYFFVTNNIFVNPRNEVINEKYDLKGSWVDRNAKGPQVGDKRVCMHCNQNYIYTKAKNLPHSASQRISKLPSKLSLLQRLSRSSALQLMDPMNTKCPMHPQGHEPNIVMKDNDIRYKIRISARVAKHLIAQLHRDCDFLCNLGVMDYSLLVGVHNTEYVVGDTASSVASDRKYSETPNSLDNIDPELDERISDEILNDDDMRRLQVSHVVGPKAYYIGIVDFQQEFDLPKQMERFFKVNIMGKSAEGISCMEPVAYKERFLHRVEELLLIDED